MARTPRVRSAFSCPQLPALAKANLPQKDRSCPWVNIQIILCRPSMHCGLTGVAIAGSTGSNPLLMDIFIVQQDVKRQAEVVAEGPAFFFIFFRHIAQHGYKRQAFWHKCTIFYTYIFAQEPRALVTTAIATTHMSLKGQRDFFSYGAGWCRKDTPLKIWDTLEHLNLF